MVEIAEPPSTLAVGTWQPFIDGFIEHGGAKDVDYVHGDDALERLAQQAGHVGVFFAGIGKSELMRRVVHEGPAAAQDVLDGRGAREAVLRRGAAHRALSVGRVGADGPGAPGVTPCRPNAWVDATPWQQEARS